MLGNIAAVSWMKNTADVTTEDWRRMFAINVDGTYFMCQAALPHILAGGGQHHQHRLQRSLHGLRVPGALLRHQGCCGADDPSPGNRVRQGADTHQRHRPRVAPTRR